MEKWSDQRLDDLNGRVESGFSRIDADLRDIRGEVSGLRSEMNSRFDALQRTMLQVGGGLIAALMGVIATLMALVVTQV
jgi:hypothetical protein